MALAHCVAASKVEAPMILGRVLVTLCRVSKPTWSLELKTVLPLHAATASAPTLTPVTGKAANKSWTVLRRNVQKVLLAIEMARF